MKYLVIYNNRPIYATNDTTLDWWFVGKGLATHSSFSPDIDEYKSMPDAFKGQMIRGYDLAVWRWNKIQRDWTQLELTK
jgi:hypothetical protein